MPSPTLLGTRVQFPPPPFDSLRSLMAGQQRIEGLWLAALAHGRPAAHRRALVGCARSWQASSVSNALSKRSAPKGSGWLRSLMAGQQRVECLAGLAHGRPAASRMLGCARSCQASSAWKGARSWQASSESNALSERSASKGSSRHGIQFSRSVLRLHRPLLRRLIVRRPYLGRTGTCESAQRRPGCIVDGVPRAGTHRVPRASSPRTGSGCARTPVEALDSPEETRIDQW